MTRKSLSLLIAFHFLMLTLGDAPFYVPKAFADSTASFYTVNQRWNNRFKYVGTKQAKIEQGVGFFESTKFQPALKGPAVEYFKEKLAEIPTDDYVIKPPQAIYSKVSDLRAAPQTVEIELDQILTLEGHGIQRYVVTTPGRVGLFLAPDRDLQIKGLETGTTFLHLWDQEGRITIPIRVIPSKRFAEYVRKREASVERSDSLKIEYDQTRSAFYTGNDFEGLKQNSLTYTQSFHTTGDTPYGRLRTDTTLREFDNKTEITDISARLTNGHVGSFENFDLTVGDESVTPNLLTLPGVRVRGLTLQSTDHHTAPEYTVFYGRELNSVIGSTLPGSAGQGIESADAFVGGALYRLKPFEKADWQFAYFQAYGQEREEELNDNAFEIVQKYNLTDKWSVTSDAGYDDAKVVHKLTTEYVKRHMNLKAEYRDINKKFFSITGTPLDHGQQGLRFWMTAQPTDTWDVSYFADLYRDKQFPYAGESDRYNLIQNFDSTLYLTQDASLRVDYRGNEATGLLAPFRDEVLGATIFQSFIFVDHPFAVSARLQTQDNEDLSTPAASYRKDTATLSLNTNLFWNINFSYGHEMSILEEVNLHLINHPNTNTYTLTHSSQIADTPLSLDLTVRYTDEEETESTRSFLLGEDRFELSGGLRYTIQNMEFYVDGRYTNIRGEDRANENAAAEAEIITGVRYLFDTGMTWEPKASFQGFVFKDLNTDGVKQEDEPGMPGVRLKIGEHEVTTDAAGYYQTPEVSGKRANIIVDANTIPYGFTGTSSLRKDVYIKESQELVNIGLVGKSRILGFVFNDFNGNGRLDREDVGVEQVRAILDQDKVLLTDSIGRFQYYDVTAGSHDLEIDLRSIPIGFLPQGKLKQTFELFEGMAYRMAIPLRAQRTLTGVVFVDANENGVLDAGESGVGSAKVRLSKHVAVTDEEGYYLFTEIPYGEFLLSVIPDSIGSRSTSFSKVVNFDEHPAEKSIHIPVK